MELNKKRILAALGVTTTAARGRPPPKAARSGEFRAKIGGHTEASAKVARSGEFRAKISGHIEAFLAYGGMNPGELVTMSPTTSMVKNGLLTPDPARQIILRQIIPRTNHRPISARASVAMATGDASDAWRPGNQTFCTRPPRVRSTIRKQDADRPLSPAPSRHTRARERERSEREWESGRLGG